MSLHNRFLFEIPLAQKTARQSIIRYTHTKYPRHAMSWTLDKVERFLSKWKVAIFTKEWRPCKWSFWKTFYFLKSCRAIDLLQAFDILSMFQLNIWWLYQTMKCCFLDFLFPKLLALVAEVAGTLPWLAEVALENTKIQVYENTLKYFYFSSSQTCTAEGCFLFAHI